MLPVPLVRLTLKRTTLKTIQNKHIQWERKLIRVMRDPKRDVALGCCFGVMEKTPRSVLQKTKNTPKNVSAHSGRERYCGRVLNTGAAQGSNKQGKRKTRQPLPVGARHWLLDFTVANHGHFYQHQNPTPGTPDSSLDQHIRMDSKTSRLADLHGRARRLHGKYIKTARYKR